MLRAIVIFGPLALVSLAHAVSAVQIQYTPGLWREDSAMIGGYGAHHTSSAELTSILQEGPEVKGLLQPVLWGHLESPEGGTYDFRYLDSMCAQLGAAGKKMIISIWLGHPGPKPRYSFNPNELPLYLRTYPNGGIQPMRYGLTAAFTRPEITDRLILLTNAIARHFNGTASFEGIEIPETAYEEIPPVDPTWNQQAIVDQMLRWAISIRQAMPGKLVTTRWNWVSSANAHLMVKAMLKYNIGNGTTDATSRTYSNNLTDIDKVVMGLDGGVDYRGLIVQTPHSEYPPFARDESAVELVGWVIKRLKANYFFPSRDGKGFAVNNQWADIKSEVARQGGLVVEVPYRYDSAPLPQSSPK